MVQSEKRDLIARVLGKQLGGIALWQMPDTPPLLGPKYLEEIEDLREKVSSFVQKQAEILSIQDFSDLSVAYDTKGVALDEEIENHWREVRQSSPVKSNTFPIYLAGLGKPGLFADFDYWSRMEWIELQEALWLCVGLDPSEDWTDRLTHHSAKKAGHRQELKHMNAKLKQLARFAATIDPLQKKFSEAQLLAWIEATGFPAHPGFIEMLRTKTFRENTRELRTDEIALTAKKKEDPRTVRAIARIITAIAIEEYGYNPKSARSPIPGEIVAIMDRLGLQATSETVLKYLKIGASELPDDWDAR